MTLQSVGMWCHGVCDHDQALIRRALPLRMDLALYSGRQIVIMFHCRLQRFLFAVSLPTFPLTKGPLLFSCPGACLLECMAPFPALLLALLPEGPLCDRTSLRFSLATWRGAETR